MYARQALTFVITAFVLLVLPAVRAIAEEQNASIENEFIRIVVNRGPKETGRFSIETTGGDPTRPTSKMQQLIYGGNTPWTSFTTVRVDDANYVFGGDTERRAGLNANYGIHVSGPTVADNRITTAYQYGEIVVTQELSFVRGSSSRMLDTASITYRIANQGKTPHQVGLRVMLDTKLGPNDGAPVRAGENAITKATIISGKDLPAYWQAFDALDSPTVVSQGSFYGGSIDATRPDRVIYADWGTLADDVWEPTLDPEQGFIRKGEDEDDTATALYWEPVFVDPGKSITYTTNYGIGYVQIKSGQLIVGITAPAETTFEYERTQPITVTGYLKNNSDFEGHNVTLTLQLPEGLKLDGGSKITQTIEAFKPGDELQASWRVISTGKTNGKAPILLNVTSENMESNQTSWDMQLNVPKPKLTLSPNTQRVPLKTNKRPTMVPININLLPAVDFYGTRFTLTYNSAVMKPHIVSRGSALVENAQLLEGWEYDTSEDGKIVITARRNNATRLTQAEINLATITFRVVGEGACPLTLESAVLLNEQGEETPVMTSAGQVEVKAD